MVVTSPWVLCCAPFPPASLFLPLRRASLCCSRKNNHGVHTLPHATTRQSKRSVLSSIFICLPPPTPTLHCSKHTRHFPFQASGHKGKIVFFSCCAKPFLPSSNKTVEAQRAKEKKRKKEKGKGWEVMNRPT